MIDDLVLRKYPHRRFYDASRSRFLRLSEIAKLIKAGARAIACDRHGRDITAELFARIIISEQAKTKDGPLTPAGNAWSHPSDRVGHLRR